jgi:hypothetical protein
MPLRTVFGFGWAFTVALLGGCRDTALPGNLLGTYKVVAQSQSNSCGLAAPDPWTFDVQLSENGSTLYLSFMDGSPPLSSAISTLAQATMTANQVANVDTEADGGAGPCLMSRTDNVGVTLTGGSPPSSFTGTIQYAFSAANGTDCTDQLKSSGGQYGTLPCTVAYAMSASRQ